MASVGEISWWGELLREGGDRRRMVRGRVEDRIEEVVTAWS